MTYKTCIFVGLGIALAAVSNLRADDAKTDAAKTYKVDDEGFIRNWLVLGPIAVDPKVDDHTEEACKEFLDKEYFNGQKDAKPRAGDKVKVGDVETAWQAAEAANFSLDTNKIAESQSKGSDHTVFLGVAYVVVPADVPQVRLVIGSDDDSVWSVNGTELIRVYAERPLEKDTNRSDAITLNQGTNIVTFTLINGEGPSGICARFIDRNDKPVTGMTVSLAPAIMK